MTRDDWQAALIRYEDALEPFTTDNGATLTADAPAALVKMYDHLICVGLEREWLELSAEGALV